MDSREGDEVKPLPALLGAISCVAVTLWAGPLAPELIPLDPEFSEFGSMRRYHLVLRDTLLGPRDGHVCDVLVVPSFEREWAVYVQPQGNDVAVVTYAVMDTSLWGKMHHAAEAAGGDGSQEALDAALVRVPKGTEVKAAPLRAYTAALLERVWSEMLSRARERPADGGFTLDGTGYYFLQRAGAGAWRAGGAWSPKAGTNTAALVDVVLALRRHAMAPPTDHATSEAKLVSEALLLLKRLSGAG
jgi:hypothetical protein